MYGSAIRNQLFSICQIDSLPAETREEATKRADIWPFAVTWMLMVALDRIRLTRSVARKEPSGKKPGRQRRNKFTRHLESQSSAGTTASIWKRSRLIGKAASGRPPGNDPPVSKVIRRPWRASNRSQTYNHNEEAKRGSSRQLGHRTPPAASHHNCRRLPSASTHLVKPDIPQRN